MCFQGFVYFLCGHNRIFSDNCALATEHPFYMQINCPDYKWSSAHPSRPCGIGGYYCAQDRNGIFLDQVHEASTHAQNALQEVDSKLATLKGLADRFTQEADARKLSHEARKQTTEYNKIQTAYAEWKEKRKVVQKSCIEAMTTIQQAQRWYSDRNNHLDTSSSSSFPAMVPSSGFLHSTPGELSSHTLSQPHMPSTSPSLTRVQDASRLLGHWQQSPEDVRVMRQQHAGEGHNQHVQHSAPARRKRSRAFKRLAEDEATAETPKAAFNSTKQGSTRKDAGNVRRSARVRNKKISYAEDTGSSVTSRDASPEKSDASGFMPSRSDASGHSVSPAKSDLNVPRRRGSRPNKPQAGLLARESSSLVDRIGDWRKRSNIVASPLQRRAPLSLRDMLNSTPEKPAAHNTVPHNYTHGLPHGVAYIQPGAMPNMGRTTQFAPTYLPSGIPASLADQSAQSEVMNTYHRALHNSVAGMAPPSSYATQRTNFHTEYRTPPMPHSAQQWTVHRASSNPTNLYRIDVPPAPLYDTPGSVYPSSTLHSSPMERHDSVMGYHGLARSASDVFPARPDYEHMRRSLDKSAVSLTPSTLDLQASAEHTDPRKRGPPPSSPLPTSKRMRLSLPEQTLATEPYRNNTVLDEQSLHMPPSPEVSSQQAPENDQALPTIEGADGLPPTLAPVLTPTAVMYHPAEGANSGRDGDALPGDGLALPGQQWEGSRDGEAEATPGAGYEEIDWGMVNDDEL